MSQHMSHVIGFDDAPFAREHRGDVLVVGAVYSGLRLEGVVSGRVRRDGTNSTSVLVRVISRSKFGSHLQVILLQGIAFAGFNVIDLPRLHSALSIPVIAVARKQPDMAAIRRALLTKVPGGERKWSLIRKLGPMEGAAKVYVQRAGISLEDTVALIDELAVNGALPEPLRTAHLIAGGVAAGESRHRP